MLLPWEWYCFSDVSVSVSVGGWCVIVLDMCSDACVLHGSVSVRPYIYSAIVARLFDGEELAEVIDDLSGGTNVRSKQGVFGSGTIKSWSYAYGTDTATLDTGRHTMYRSQVLFVWG